MLVTSLSGISRRVHFQLLTHISRRVHFHMLTHISHLCSLSTINTHLTLVHFHLIARISRRTESEGEEDDDDIFFDSVSAPSTPRCSLTPTTSSPEGSFSLFVAAELPLVDCVLKCRDDHFESPAPASRLRNSEEELVGREAMDDEGNIDLLIVESPLVQMVSQTPHPLLNLRRKQVFV